MEVHNIVKEVVSKTIPKKKKCKKAKWLSEEALQIAEERREAKSKGGRERYTKVNVEGEGKMAEESDGKTTFSLTNSSKEHFNAEQTSQNNFCRLAEDIRQREKQIIVFKNR